MDRRGAALFGAGAAASALVTAGFRWEAVLLGWALGGVVLALLPAPGKVRGRLTAGVELLGALAVLAAALVEADGAFPARTTFPFVSLALLLILWRAMRGRRQGMTEAANVLGLFLLAVLGGVTLLGLGDVRWTENRPAAAEFSWRQVYITLGTVSPWWCLRWGRRTAGTWGWFGGNALLAVAMSLLTHGVLGRGLAAWSPAPLCRAVQAIRLLGVLQRLEAFLAASMLLGTFGLMLLIADRAAEAVSVLLRPQWSRWATGGLLLAAFLLEYAYRAVPAAVSDWGKAVFWGAAPVFALWVVGSTKFRKRA